MNIHSTDSLVIHEARIIGKWLSWSNWYQANPLALNSHETGQNILSNYVQTLDNRLEGS